LSAVHECLLNIQHICRPSTPIIT